MVTTDQSLIEVLYAALTGSLFQYLKNYSIYRINKKTNIYCIQGQNIVSIGVPLDT